VTAIVNKPCINTVPFENEPVPHFNQIIFNVDIEFVNTANLEFGHSPRAPSCDTLQVRVVRLKVMVIMIQAPRREALHTELTDCIRPRHSVRRAGYLDSKLNLKMTNFQQNDGQVMNE